MKPRRTSSLPIDLLGAARGNRGVAAARRGHRAGGAAGRLAPLLCAAAALVLQPRGPEVAGARAQMAMPDPAQMSGIPRPDPSVPAATVTVRLIRGELANRLVGVDAQLVDLQNKDAPPRTAKTDAEGRATFPTLPPGNYQARAVLDSETLSSQPIAVQPAPAPGVRVMLVFSKSLADQQKELGTPDGKLRTDQALPAGTLVVKAVDEAAQPLPGLRVTLLRADRSTEKVESLPPQNTGEDGTARFTDLPSSATLEYLAIIQRDGVDQRTQPFRLSGEHGSQVALSVKAVVRDQAALRELKIGNGSHLILELADDTVQVLENLRLLNPLPQAVDPGPEGVRIPLAEGALSAQALPGGPAAVSIDASKDGPPVVVWKGPLPPGATDVRVGFVLKHHGQVTFRQVVAQPYEGLKVVMEKLPGVQLERVSDAEDRKFQGKDLVLATVPVPSVGSTIEFSVSGLPAELLTLRYAAAILALFIGLGFAYLALYGKKETDQASSRRRQKLEQRRDALLAELVATEQREAEPEAGASAKAKPQKTRPREKTLSDLEQIYRHLDELDGN